MKVIGVVAIVVSVSAILSYSHGVSTLGPANGNNTEAITFTDGNNSTIIPGMNVNGTGLNPVHGKPGHRCDIAVGQPLNSKPTTQPSMNFNPATLATTPSIKPVRTFTPPVNPATGLNPPHGQPGHRCDIRVGEPLSSKPSQQTTAPAIGLNPKHGLPGHRCDIAVGQPLNSKPLKKS